MPKVRLGLTKLATAKLADTVVVCEPDWSAIAAVAANKLKLKPKQIRRLLLKVRVHEHAAGTELPKGDCTRFLCDDALIFVSTFDALPAAALAPALDEASLPTVPAWPATTATPSFAEAPTVEHDGGRAWALQVLCASHLGACPPLPCAPGATYRLRWPSMGRGGAFNGHFLYQLYINIHRRR